MKRLSFFCTAAMAAAMLPPVHAATTEDAVVVTATRTADETLASVSVITRDDIERAQAKNVTELLAGETGLDPVIPEAVAWLNGRDSEMHLPVVYRLEGER